MAQKKSTKKFEKNHLQDTIKRRKEFAKIKQRHQQKEKKKARRAQDNAPADAEQADGRPSGKEEKKNNAFEEMNVDDFFQGGFEIPTESRPQKKAGKATGTYGRKRKLQDVAQEDAEASSADESTEQNPVEAGSEPGSDNDDDDIGMSKEQMDALAKKDPEFYKYLQENDAELLQFEDADLGEIDALSGSEAEEEGPIKKKQKKGKSSKQEEDEAEDSTGNEITKTLVNKWKRSMTEQHSLRATREVVLAFRAAAHISDEEDKEFKYSISNPDAYHELLVVALEQVPKVLQHHLPVKEKESGKISVPTDSKKYRTLTPLLKSHVTSITHLLNHLSDAATLRLTLSSLVPLLPYILSFKKLVRDLARTVVTIWSESSSAEASRIAAFLVLRRLVVIGDPGIRESVLKTTYQGLVKGSRNTTVHTISGVNLMKNSAAELWGIDSSVGYTNGFTFIRQLAIHLRSSITNNSNESYKAIYNWQFVHSLDFWSRVLAAHCDSLAEAEKGAASALRPLIYPVVQVTLGAMRLIPTATYFPLRFHLIRSLLRVSLSTGTYIPLAASLYEVLNSAEMRKAPVASTLKPLDFATAIRAPKSYLRTRVYQDGVGEQVAELLSEFFVLWAKSIAFPELALPVIVLLKRWSKDTGMHGKNSNKNGKVNGQMSLVVQKLDANTKWIEERRGKVDFAPNDRAGVEGFLKEVEWQKTPLGAFVVGQRKTRAEKARLLEESRKEEEKKREEEKAERKLGREDADGMESEADEEEEDDEDEVEDLEDEAEDEDEDSE